MSEKDDLATPFLFLDFWMTVMNGLQNGRMPIAPAAYEDFKTLLLAMSQRVIRPQTGEERIRVRRLSMLPRAFGGLG